MKNTGSSGEHFTKTKLFTKKRKGQVKRFRQMKAGKTIAINNILHNSGLFLKFNPLVLPG